MNLREQAIALVAFLRREIGRFLRLWQQTLLPPVITTALYFLIFGQVIGQRVGEMNQIPYILFIVPGLLAMSVITSSYANASFALFSMKFQRSIEEMLVSPMSPGSLLTGFIVASMVRGMMVACLVFTAALFFVEIRPQYPLAMIAALLLSSCFFSFTGFINGIYARNFDDVNVVPNFVLTPLIYLGGVFYSVNLLPEPWQTISLLNPIFYLVDMQRYAMLGISDVPIQWTVLSICAFTLIAGTCCMVLIRRGTGLQE